MIGLQFNGKHSYNDYALFLSEPPDFGVPEPKVTTVDIPGRDSVLDYTEAATGEVKYKNRAQKFVFATMIPQERRDALMDEIRNDLHGKTVEIIYDLDPEWYYTGRAFVSFESVMSWKMKVVITVDAQPYKLARNNTTLTIAPTSFSSEQIFLGEGTAAQHANSIFEFGTASAPQLDLTQFSKLTFIWPTSSDVPIGTPNLQIVDSAGQHYDSTTGSNTLVDGLPAMDLSVSNISGITKSSVYRILCQGRPMVKLVGTTTSSATTMAMVDRMSVCPMWSASAAVTAFINGRKFTIPAGGSQNYDIRLKQGENQISFISDSDETTIQIQYTNGRL